MFIYKITVIPLNKIYIGLDTKSEYKKARWKIHCNESKINPKGKLHKAIHKYGIENCNYEVIERNFDSTMRLALAEINYIRQFNSYYTGLNSSLGGDGLGRYDLTTLTDEEISLIRESLGNNWKLYNKKKWSNTTSKQRKKMMEHCHTEEANKKKSSTLKDYYNSIPLAKEIHSKGIRKWQKENPELAKKFRIANGLKGAEKTSKKITVIREDNSIEVYNSISEFQRQTGQWYCTIKKKSNENKFHCGYKIKD